MKSSRCLIELVYILSSLSLHQHGNEQMIVTRYNAALSNLKNKIEHDY